MRASACRPGVILELLCPPHSFAWDPAWQDFSFANHVVLNPISYLLSRFLLRLFSSPVFKAEINYKSSLHEPSLGANLRSSRSLTWRIYADRALAAANRFMTYPYDVPMNHTAHRFMIHLCTIPRVNLYRPLFIMASLDNERIKRRLSQPGRLAVKPHPEPHPPPTWRISARSRSQRAAAGYRQLNSGSSAAGIASSSTSSLSAVAHSSRTGLPGKYGLCQSFDAHIAIFHLDHPTH
jgi:hypothetical protein